MELLEKQKRGAIIAWIGQLEERAAERESRERARERERGKRTRARRYSDERRQLAIISCLCNLGA